MNDKEFEEWKKQKDKEHDKLDKLIKKFSDEIFKQNPQLEGISITALMPKDESKEKRRINGFYIENKKFAKEGKQE